MGRDVARPCLSSVDGKKLATFFVDLRRIRCELRPGVIKVALR